MKTGSACNPTDHEFVGRFRLQSELKKAVAATNQQCEELKSIREAQAESAQNLRSYQGQIKSLEETLHRLLTSKSWRITAPMRAITAKFRRA
jgi:hypothetical protein